MTTFQSTAPPHSTMEQWRRAAGLAGLLQPLYLALTWAADWGWGHGWRQAQAQAQAQAVEPTELW